MERWYGRVAIVTGATSGIGKAIAESLAKHGLKVVGLGRRVDRLQELHQKLSQTEGIFYSIKADLRNEDDILKAFKWVGNNLGGVDVLINNAGLLKSKMLEGQDTESWRQMYDTNVVALQICCREALKLMRANNINDGHIINISSVAAHASVPIPEMATYFATKKAVNCISAGLRSELSITNSDIRVTEICPGLVATEIFGVPTDHPEFNDIMDAALKSSDVADSVIFALQAPPKVLLFFGKIHNFSLRKCIANHDLFQTFYFLAQISDLTVKPVRTSPEALQTLRRITKEVHEGSSK